MWIKKKGHEEVTSVPFEVIVDTDRKIFTLVGTGSRDMVWRISSLHGAILAAPKLKASCRWRQQKYDLPNKTLPDSNSPALYYPRVSLPVTPHFFRKPAIVLNLQ